jgi:hypothetical protein
MTAAWAALGLALAGADGPGYTYPPREARGVAVTLTVRVADAAAGPARARATVSLRVTGPAALEVEGPRLEDALAAWKVAQGGSSWAEDGGRASVEETLLLEQVKPGAVPLPGLTLRARAGPGSAWEEFSWPELLMEAREPPGPIPLPPGPPSPWPRRLAWLAGAAALLAALLLLGYAGRRLAAAWRTPATPARRALARLADAPADPAAALTHTDRVLRGYLEERFGAAAPRQTPRELLYALAQAGALSAAQQVLLAGLLAQGDLLKFAQAPSPEAVGRLQEQARAFIRATAAAGEAWPVAGA